MAASLIDLVMERKISPHDLILWLNEIPVSEISDDLSHLRLEFVPTFLSFLHDQSSNILQAGLPSGAVPNKVVSSVRVTKYISPGKDSGLSKCVQKQKLPSRAKTLLFSDISEKEKSSSSEKQVQGQELEHLLLKSESAFVCAVGTGLSPSGNHINQKQGKNNTSTAWHSGCNTSPKYDSPSPSSREHHHRGKRQSMEGTDHGSWKVHNSEIKHSEQRLSLGDFITTDSKLRNRRKSPLSKDVNSTPVGKAGEGRSLRHQEMPKIIDINDQEAFPMVGSVSSHDRQQKRRINPTRIIATSARQPSKSSPFSQSSKAVFGIPQNHFPSSPFLSGEGGGSKSLEKERELLRQERLKRQETDANANSNGKDDKSFGKESALNQVQRKQMETSNNYVLASPDLVTDKGCLDILIRIYAELILYNMAPSIMVELYYLIQLLTVRVIVGSENSERNEQLKRVYLNTAHNCVYFATNVLLMIIEVLKLLDKGTLKLLTENPYIQVFSEELQRFLLEYLETPPAPILPQAPKSPIGGVSFQTETDNRNNFPSDQAFHIFRKQRDMFYEMLRIWEENHLTSGWVYGQALGSRIRQLLCLRPSSTNLVHFARLFQSQLLTMCRGDDDHSHFQQESDGFGFLTLLKKQHPEKYKRLYERLVTPSKLGGPCPPPSFPGSQEFFRDFIVTASSYSFNQHLKDVLISHILMFNEQEFVIPEPEEGDQVDSMIHEEARSVILNLRLLAKFLSFLEFLPYQTSEHLPENVMATQISLRSRVCPPLNLCAALRQCALSGQLVVGVTWVVEYLSMVDPVALHSRQYLTVIMTLISIFKLLYVIRPKKSTECLLCSAAHAARSFAPSNSLLLKLLLGWLFDLPNFPDGLFFVDVCEADIDHWEYNQTLDVLSANYIQLCVACLRLLLLPTKNIVDVENALADTVSAGDISHIKSLTSRESCIQVITKSPSKNKSQVTSTSPAKTPSKFLSVSMLESPLTTPLKPTDTQAVTEHALYLDARDFVDQQMITICCPFISELKNLLNNFWLGMSSNKSSNSYRKITPLSTSDKTSPAKSQMQLQLQLEDNFFHNHPSSVRKTTDFVIERVSSNVIKNVRTKMIPELRESALEQLKHIIDNGMQSPSKCVERTRDAVQKHVVKLSQEMTQQMKTKSTQMALEQCNKQIIPALSLLLPPDISQQGVEVCKKLVSRCSQEKVTSWIQSHLTPAIFSKDLTADGDRLLRQAQKAADFQATAQQASGCETTLSNISMSDASSVLGADNSVIASHSGPSFLDGSLNSPTNQPRQMRVIPKKPASNLEGLPLIATEHDIDVPSPSQSVITIKEMVRGLTKGPVGDLANEQQIRMSLEDVRRTFTRRQDVTLAVFRALEALTVDLAVAVAACVPKLMTPEMQKMFVNLWKPVNDGGVIPKPGCLSSVLCPRTIMLIAQNPATSHQKLVWKKIEELLSMLILAELMTPATLLDQCVALLRHTWPQEILSGISSCIEGVSQTALKQKAFEDDSTLIQMLDWVSWVCDQMDDLSEDIVM